MEKQKSSACVAATSCCWQQQTVQKGAIMKAILAKIKSESLSPQAERGLGKKAF